jgi:rhodanese-related sulfurtransferase
MQKLAKVSVSAIAALLVAITLAACAPSTPNIKLKDVAAVIDVRTKEEFIGGHLDGAFNIDVESPDFATKLESLDKAANYVVYCHSGRRAGIAIDYMKSHDFTGTLTNAGGIADATVSTGLPIIAN